MLNLYKICDECINNTHYGPWYPTSPLGKSKCYMCDEVKSMSKIKIVNQDYMRHLKINLILN